jgi:hypothetical protein
MMGNPRRHFFITSSGRRDVYALNVACSSANTLLR